MTKEIAFKYNKKGLPEYSFEFEIRRWRFHIQIIRYRWHELIYKSRQDILFYTSIGYGVLADRLMYGFNFYIDALRFNKTDEWKSFGFSIPIKPFNFSKYGN